MMVSLWTIHATGEPDQIERRKDQQLEGAVRCQENIHSVFRFDSVLDATGAEFGRRLS